MRAKQDELARRQGHRDHDALMMHRKLKRAGYAWCIACERNVRPLAALFRLRKRCPICAGTLFRPPVAP